MSASQEDNFPIVMEEDPENNLLRYLHTKAATMDMDGNDYFNRNIYRFFGNAKARENAFDELRMILRDPTNPEYDQALDAAIYNAAFNQYTPQFDLDGTRGEKSRDIVIDILIQNKIIELQHDSFYKIDVDYMLEQFRRLNDVQNSTDYISTIASISNMTENIMVSNRKARSEAAVVVLLDEIKNGRYKRFDDETQGVVLKSILKSFKVIVDLDKGFTISKYPKYFTKENIYHGLGDIFYYELFGEDFEQLTALQSA
jgi:hypothetical protein